MGEILFTAKLENLYHKKHSCENINVIEVVPFITKRKKVINQYFNYSLGEFVRNICGVNNLKNSNRKEDIQFEGNPYVEKIMQNITYDEQNMFDLKRFLDAVLLGENQQLQPNHIYLYNFLPAVLPGKETENNELKKLGKFMRDVLVVNKQLREVFNDQSTDNILTKLIINSLDSLDTNDADLKYEPLLKEFSNLYEEDIKYLKNFQHYFLEYFPMLTNYYSFMYICQLLIKFDRFNDDEDFEKIEHLYFVVDWESVNSRRDAVKFQGYRERIQQRASRLFVHLNVIAQLSNNKINKEVSSTTKLHFLHYKKLTNILESKDTQVIEQFISDVNEWILKYCEIWDVTPPIEMAFSLDKVYKNLFHSVEQGINKEAAKKYGQNIDDLGAPFLKQRGRYGNVLNVKKDFLQLLTAVSVKDRMLTLNELFIEFEKRGVFFDRYSKQEIVQYFERLNIIDKKSDSGDAQYVKPVLQIYS